MRTYFEKMYKGDDLTLYRNLEQALVNGVKTLLVTANPEIFMKSEQKEVDALLKDPMTIISPDGEGIVKGATMLGYHLWGKIAGVETVEAMLQHLHNHNLRLAVYGSKQDVLDAFQKKLNHAYPNIVVACLLNGYDHSQENAKIELQNANADCILVALGVPRQELFLYDLLPSLAKGVCIGCGGSIDVLSGVKKRAPKVFIQLKLEWLYRILREPKRIRRFYDSNVRYVMKLRSLQKEVK